MTRKRTPNGEPPRPHPEHASSELMTPEEVARLLRVTLPQLRRWRLVGTGPRALRLGGETSRNVRYLRRDVDAYLAACAEGNARDQASRAKRDAKNAAEEATP